MCAYMCVCMHVCVCVSVCVSPTYKNRDRQVCHLFKVPVEFFPKVSSLYMVNLVASRHLRISASCHIRHSTAL